MEVIVMYRLSPEECALILCIAVKRLSQERERKTTRFQLSSVALSRISKRSFIDPTFINNLSSEIRSYGWCMFQVANTKYAFIKASSIKSWIKISSRGVSNETKELAELKRNYDDEPSIKTERARDRYISKLRHSLRKTNEIL